MIYFPPIHHHGVHLQNMKVRPNILKRICFILKLTLKGKDPGERRDVRLKGCILFLGETSNIIGPISNNICRQEIYYLKFCGDQSTTSHYRSAHFKNHSLQG